MFLSPIALGCVSARFQEMGTVARWLERVGFRTIHHIPTAWDWQLNQAKPCWIIVTLKNGSRVFGYFGERSFAGSDPQQRDLFLEAMFRPVETGDWAPVEETAGVLIMFDQISAIEFRKESEVDDEAEA